MAQSIDTQLLNALELFQYSYRFRRTMFVLVLEPEIPFSDILSDLKLLQASHVSVTIVCEHSAELKSMLTKLSLWGLRCSYRPRQLGEEDSEKLPLWVKVEVVDESIPVLGIEGLSGSDESKHLLRKEAMEIAALLDAEKVFLMSQFSGLEVEGKLQSYVSPKELREILAQSKRINVQKEELEFLLQSSQEHGTEIVLLEGKSGSLFLEIFTHQGRGTLFTDEYPNVIRAAQLKDVVEISLLLKPYMDKGSIRKTTDVRIAEEIASYHVYAVNQAVVAAVQLEDYGSAAALSRFCALPRFQGKGRARQLARKMIELAESQGKDYIFALSIAPRMWSFFKSLGFSETAREDLPEAWQKHYDFSRPSQAFKLEFS